MRSDTTTYVGLDVHKRTIAVSMVVASTGEVREWQETNDPTVARRLARRLQREAGGPVSCCYEAGPTGYVLQRRLRSEGVMCTVVAPSLIPVRPGSAPDEQVPSSAALCLQGEREQLGHPAYEVAAATAVRGGRQPGDVRQPPIIH